jgi:DNA (cytosine-5)-methyltransferase 1
MWPEAIRAIRETLPRAFLFENVRGIVRPAFAEYLTWIVANLERPQLTRGPDETATEHLRKLRATNLPALYEVHVHQVNAADYGAPQKRHRVLIVGMRRDGGSGLSELRPTHSRERLLWDQWVTGDYWRRHALRIPGDEFIERNDRAVVNMLRNTMFPPPGRPWRTVRDALEGLGEPNGKKNHVFQPGAKVYVGHTGSALDQPAKALKAGDHGVPGGENMLIDGEGYVRYFTVRESARLQGLPDTYTFPGSWTESMRQLGNAVPAQLAETIGRWLSAQLRATELPKRVA